MDKLARDKVCFDKVTQPTLVHWDMWEGNIFVKAGHVVGVIDWERALWAKSIWMTVSADIPEERIFYEDMVCLKFPY